jgi:hypothetical protein
MARKTQPKPSSPTAEKRPPPSVSTAVVGGRTDDEDDPLAALAAVRQNDVLHIQRLWPPSDAGWLGDVDLPPGGIDDLYQLIADQFGGGRYSLRIKRRRADNNGLPFTSIAAKITIAGPPKSQVPEQHYAPQQNPAPIVVQSGGSGSEQLQAQLLGMLGKLVQSGGGNGTNLAELAKVIFQATNVSQAKNDSLGELEKMLGLWSKMSKVFAPRTASDSEPSASPLAGLLGGGGGQLENILITKILGGLGGGAPPVQQPPAIPPAPSPAHCWHPTHGWFVPANLAPKPAPPPPAPPSPPPSETAASKPRLVEVDDDDAPLTADELAADIDQLDEAERDKLLSRLMQQQMAKIDPGEMQRIMNGGAVSVADSYPLTADEG